VVFGPYPIHFKCVSPITSLAEAINSDKSRPWESSYIRAIKETANNKTLFASARIIGDILLGI